MAERKEVVLGIDPGTNCGWAVRDASGLYTSGVWDLTPKRHMGAGMRYVLFRKHLGEVLDTFKPNRIVYEEVRRHRGTAAAHVYGAIVGHLTEVAEQRSIPYMGIPVGTIKKTATGNGVAKKDAMIAAAAIEWPDAQVTDDNEADARWIVETYLVQ